MSEKYDIKTVIKQRKETWSENLNFLQQDLQKQRNDIDELKNKLKEMKAVELELIEKYEKCAEGISDADRAIDFLTYGQVRPIS